MAEDSASHSQTPDRAYRVLARKYRPRTFDDLIGQEAMVRTLSNAFDLGRLPQAWMLTGVRGVGKTTTARILARALNYDLPGKVDRPTIHMPQYGTHCEAIIEGRHIDVQEMDAASHTGINDIREIIDAVRYTPMSARYKVYIIDEVHMLSTQAFNGLLKTLEEPPEHVKFVFATTEIRKVPVTVLSRCQRFDLRRIDIDVLSAHLQKIAAAESMRLRPDAALLIARAAEGSVRDALSLLDQANVSAGEEITAETIRHMLGLADRLRIFELIDTVMRGDAGQALALFAAQYRDGADPATLVGELAEAIHALTRAKVAGVEAGAEALPEAERQQIARLSAALSHATLSRAWQMLLKGLEEVSAAPRPASAAEMLLVRLCHVAELPSPEELVRQLRGGGGQAAASRPGTEQNASSGAPRATQMEERPPAPPVGAPLTPSERSTAMAARAMPRLVSETAIQPAPPPAAPAAPAIGAIVPQVELLRFEDLVAFVQAKRDIRLKLALERAVHLVRFERGRIEMRLADPHASWMVADLQRKLPEWTGERWMVALSQEEGAPTLDEKARAERQSLEDDIRAHPSVASVLQRFPGAEIVDVRFNRADQAGNDETNGLAGDEEDE